MMMTTPTAMDWHTLGLHCDRSPPSGGSKQTESKPTKTVELTTVLPSAALSVTHSTRTSTHQSGSGSRSPGVEMWCSGPQWLG